MRCFNYCRVLLFLVSFLPLCADAAYYTWYSSFFNITAGSPGAVCDQIDGDNGNLSGFVFMSETQAQCLSNAGNPVSSTNMVRNGTGCQPTYTYNTTTGGCDAPPPDPCAGKTGTSFPFRKTGMHGDGYMFGTGGNAAAAQEGCFDGCAASTADQKCITNVSGSYRCKGTAYHIGQSCGSGGAAPLEEGEVGPDEAPSNYNDTKPCVYASSNGVATCLSESKQGKEGRHCGSVNGVQTCVDSPPSENGIKISTTVTTTANADGSTTTTKKDDATKTTCKGVLSCTSIGSTSTTTTTRDGSGNTTSITGNCTGPSCADANTNPDGDGDGFGDCVGDDCGGGEGGGGASDWYEAGDDTYQSVMQAYADRIAATPVLSGVTNFLTFTPSGACPVYTVDIWVFSIRLDQWCSGSTIPWELIQAVILAAASFFSFRIAFL